MTAGARRSPPIYISSGWNAYRAVLSPGDLTGDGKVDVLAVRSSDNAMLLYPGTGTGKRRLPDHRQRVLGRLQRLHGLR